MLTSLLVAYTYQYQLILGPALVMFLVVPLAIVLRFSSLKKIMGGLLVFFGLCGTIAAVFVAFVWGFIIGTTTFMIGVFLCSFSLAREAEYKISRSNASLLFSLLAISLVVIPMLIRSALTLFIMLCVVTMEVIIGSVYTASFISRSSTTHSHTKLHLNERKARWLRKVSYVFFTVVIVASALIISLRSTNLIREGYLETYHGSSSPNLTFRGIINSVALNYEVSYGYNYHIFPAYLTVTVTEVVWSDHPWENQTTAAQYLQHQGSTLVYFEKTAVPNLAVGQKVEISGYYCQWMEDSLYSYALVVSPNVNGSYLDPL